MGDLQWSASMVSSRRERTDHRRRARPRVREASSVIGTRRRTAAPRSPAAARRTSGAGPVPSPVVEVGQRGWRCGPAPSPPPRGSPPASGRRRGAVPRCRPGRWTAGEARRPGRRRHAPRRRRGPDHGQPATAAGLDHLPEFRLGQRRYQEQPSPPARPVRGCSLVGPDDPPDDQDHAGGDALVEQGEQGVQEALTFTVCAPRSQLLELIDDQDDR